MFKFIHKHHYKKGDHRGKIVITYSVSEIVIGTLLIVATALHIYIYLSTVAASKQTRAAAPYNAVPAEKDMPVKASQKTVR